MSLVFTAKIITIRQITVDLEGFSITMATVLFFLQFLLREDALGPNRGLPTKFRQDRSKNRDRVRSLGHKD